MFIQGILQYNNADIVINGFHVTFGLPLLSLTISRVAKRQKMSQNLICGSKKCPQLYRMFDTKTFINKTSFIRILIGIKVIII